MNRAMLYSVVIAALIGIDVAANHSAVTNDVTSTVIGAGKSTKQAVYATVGFWTGQR